jgi:hypothetical protein
MTNQGKGGGQPSDDRTILDPLNADELRALREARERLQNKGRPAGAGAGAVAPAPVSEDDGTAPTRAMPAINYDSGAKVIPDPKPMTPQSARIQTGPQAQPKGPAPAPTGAQAQGQQPQQGQPGFGEHTLMWMAPVKLPEEPKVIPERGAAAGAGMIPTAVPQETPTRRILTFAIAGVLGLVLIILVMSLFGNSAAPSVVEIVTTPAKATVKINGKPTEVLTPMKATLKPGTHSVEISLKGYKTETFSLTVEAGKEAERKQIDLEPISNPGMLTVSVNVQPVAANITIDKQAFSAKKTVKVANINPKEAHKLLIEAGGYSRIEQEIPAGQLKDAYNFVLQAEKEKPE